MDAEAEWAKGVDTIMAAEISFKSFNDAKIIGIENSEADFRVFLPSFL